MAHFYGYLTGNRGTVTRCGSKKSGITAHLRSWNNDVYISLEADEDGNDKLVIRKPEGLNIEVQ